MKFTKILKSVPRTKSVKIEAAQRKVDWTIAQKCQLLCLYLQYFLVPMGP